MKQVEAAEKVGINSRYLQTTESKLFIVDDAIHGIKKQEIYRN